MLYFSYLSLHIKQNQLSSPKSDCILCTFNCNITATTTSIRPQAIKLCNQYLTRPYIFCISVCLFQSHIPCLFCSSNQLHDESYWIGIVCWRCVLTKRSIHMNAALRFALLSTILYPQPLTVSILSIFPNHCVGQIVQIVVLTNSEFVMAPLLERYMAYFTGGKTCSCLYRIFRSIQIWYKLWSSGLHYHIG